MIRHLGTPVIATWLIALMSAAIAAEPSPVAPLPPQASSETVSVHMGDVTFAIPKAIYTSLTSHGVDATHFALKLSLLPLEGADPSAARFLQVEVAYDPSGKINKDMRQGMLDFSDLTTKRTDEYGFTHYANRSGEWVEKQDERGQWISMECSALRSPPRATFSSGWPDLCSGTMAYSPTIQIGYSFPEIYLPKGLEIVTSFARILDSLKEGSQPQVVPTAMNQMVIVFTLDGAMHMAKDPGLPAPTRSQTATVATDVGRKVLLGTFTLVTVGCRVVENFQIVVSKPPMNGAFSGGIAETAENFDLRDQRYGCSGRKYKAVALFYQAKAPSMDRMSILVPDLNGNFTEVNFAITAK